MFWSRKAEPRQAGFRGVWAAAVTPHRREGFEADHAAMLELVDRLSGSGIDGIVLLGATGEFLHIKNEDRLRLVHLAVKRSRVPIIAGVSHSTLDAAIQMADAAVDSGVAGLLLMPPYFYKYTDAEILEFYRVFAVAVGGAAPVLLYNLPAFTNGISPSIAKQLLESGEFAGIKDSSGDPAMMSALAELRAVHDFSLLSGNDRYVVDAARAGYDGVVSGVAGALPELVLALWKAAGGGNSERAAMLQAHLVEFVEWIEQFPVPVGITAAVEARGARVGPPAVPLTSEQFDLLERFKTWLSAWLPEIERVCNG